MTQGKDNVVTLPRPEADLQAEVRRLLQDSDLTMRQVSRQAGLTVSVLSPWLKGKYQGDTAKVAAKVAVWLEQRREADVMPLPDAPEWQETTTGHRIFSALSYAQGAPDLVVIYGGAGVGKTVTARHYAGQRPSVWLATMTPASQGPWDALQEVSFALDLGTTTGRSSSTVFRDVVARMTETRGLLIVDEAQHLNVKALEVLRSLHDAAGIGLALLGNELVYGRLTSGTRSAEFAQLFSRIGKRVRLLQPKAGDVSDLAKAWGVTARSDVALLREIAGTPGALRSMTKTMRLASMLAAGADEPVSSTHIRAAWAELGGAK